MESEQLNKGFKCNGVRWEIIVRGTHLVPRQRTLELGNITIAKSKSGFGYWCQEMGGKMMRPSDAFLQRTYQTALENFIETHRGNQSAEYIFETLASCLANNKDKEGIIDWRLVDKPHHEIPLLPEHLYLPIMRATFPDFSKLDAAEQDQEGITKMVFNSLRIPKHSRILPMEPEIHALIRALPDPVFQETSQRAKKQKG